MERVKCWAAAVLKRAACEIGDVESVTGAFRRLFEPFLFRDSCFEEAAAARLTLLCVQLRRALDRRIPADESGEADRIRRSLEYMHSHYAEPIAVAQLACMEHLSASRFSAANRQSTGVSPRAYLIDLRIRMAADMIRRTDLHFKQIARNVATRIRSISAAFQGAHRSVAAAVSRAFRRRITRRHRACRSRS